MQPQPPRASPSFNIPLFSGKPKSEVEAKLGFLNSVELKVEKPEHYIKIGTIFQETYPQSQSEASRWGWLAIKEPEEVKIKKEVKELLPLLKNPDSPKNQMGINAIAGAFKVLTYLEDKANSTKEIQNIRQLKEDVRAAASIYNDGFRLIQLPYELLGGHGIPNNIYLATNFIQSLPVSLPNDVKESKKLIDQADVLNFLRGCENIKLKNLELLSRYDGNYGFNDDEECQNVTIMYLNIRSYLLSNEKSYPPETSKVVESVFKTIIEGSFTRNTQINSDMFASVLPQDLRTDFILEREENKNRAINDKLNSPSFLGAMNRIQNNSKLNDQEKESAIRKLTDDQYYEKEAESLVFSMEKWSTPRVDQNGLFVSADRTIGFKTLDEERTMQRDFPLDLSKVAFTSRQQVKEAFAFLQFLQTQPDSRIAKEWIKISKEPNQQTYDALVKIIQRNPEAFEKFNEMSSLSVEQKTELLKIALDFTYRITHFTLLARLSLSQGG